MALLTKQEFAAKCGMQPNKLAAYNSASRKTRIVVRADGLMDDTDQHNAAFLQKHGVKESGERKPSAERERRAESESANQETERSGSAGLTMTSGAVPEAGGEGSEVLKGEIQVGDNGQITVVVKHNGGTMVVYLDKMPDFKDSERLLKFLDTAKRKKEIQKLDIEIAKKNGEVVPSEVILPVFIRHNKSLMTAFKNACDAMLTEYSKVKDMNPEEIAHIRSAVIGETNKAMTKATELTESDVKGIVDDYSVRKGVGERN